MLCVTWILDLILKSIDKLRKRQYRLSLQCLDFTDRILFYHALTDTFCVFKAVVLIYIFMKKVCLQIGFALIWRGLLGYLPSLLLN